MDGISAETVLGALVGVAVAGILVAVLFRNKVLDMTFDERQQRARGVAYKYGFITMMACLALYGGSELLLGRWCDALAGAVLCMCLGGGVFASTCIVKGAYLSLREKPRQILVTLIAATAANLLCGAARLLEGGLVEDGVLTSRSLNLQLGLLCLVILTVYLAHGAGRDREEPEEDEEP